MKHFLRCINGEETPMVDAAAGKAILEIALAARESTELGKVVKL
jgi:hypothetical protein